MAPSSGAPDVAARAAEARAAIARKITSLVGKMEGPSDAEVSVHLAQAYATLASEPPRTRGVPPDSTTRSEPRSILSAMWMWTPRQALSIGTTMLGIALVLDGLEVFGRPPNGIAIVVGAVFIVVGGSLIWRWRRKVWD
jgi:hypothetical protein